MRYYALLVLAILAVAFSFVQMLPEGYVISPESPSGAAYIGNFMVYYGDGYARAVFSLFNSSGDCIRADGEGTLLIRGSRGEVLLEEEIAPRKEDFGYSLDRTTGEKFLCWTPRITGERAGNLSGAARQSSM
jgi:hypothetical protein